MLERGDGWGSECDMLRCNYTHLLHSGDEEEKG